MPLSPPTGYSGKPLKDKLGLKDGMKVNVINAPKDYFNWLGGIRIVTSKTPPWDFVHVFTNSIDELERTLVALRKQVTPNGIIWVSWFKKSSGIPTEIVEDTIRDTALPLGFVDIKVCAVSDVWSGLKLVVRKELRG